MAPFLLVLKKMTMPQGSDWGHGTLHRGNLSDGALNVCPDSVVAKDSMALIVRVGVLTPVSWLNSQSGLHTITVTL
jgi:hypothetical protein